MRCRAVISRVCRGGGRGRIGCGASLTARVDDLVTQARGLRAEAAFDAIEAKLVNHEQIEPGIEADAIVEDLTAALADQTIQQLAAGDAVDFVAQSASHHYDALDQSALSQTALSDEDDVLLAANEVALSQGFDLHSRDGGIEGPVEGGERCGFAEVGVLDEAFDAALAARMRRTAARV